jgi:hypothetical protein
VLRPAGTAAGAGALVAVLALGVPLGGGDATRAGSSHVSVSSLSVGQRGRVRVVGGLLGGDDWERRASDLYQSGQRVDMTRSVHEAQAREVERQQLAELEGVHQASTELAQATVKLGNTMAEVHLMLGQVHSAVVSLETAVTRMDRSTTRLQIAALVLAAVAVVVGILALA